MTPCPVKIFGTVWLMLVATTLPDIAKALPFHARHNDALSSYNIRHGLVDACRNDNPKYCPSVVARQRQSQILSIGSRKTLVYIFYVLPASRRMQPCSLGRTPRAYSLAPRAYHHILLPAMSILPLFTTSTFSYALGFRP